MRTVCWGQVSDHPQQPESWNEVEVDDTADKYEVRRQVLEDGSFADPPELRFLSKGGAWRKWENSQTLPSGDLKVKVIYRKPGLSANGAKLEQILSLLKARANPKASAISNVGSAEADAILLELGFLQEDGNKAYPIVVPAEAPNCSSFDYSQFASEDNGTPWLLEHHEKQLTQLGVRFGRPFFEIHDMHLRRDLKLLLPSGTLYNGGLDGIVAPWGLTKAGASQKCVSPMSTSNQRPRSDCTEKHIWKVLRYIFCCIHFRMRLLA
ncbi:hypothetical protein ABBQ38_015302 [Trebouxia sp. C0009 RCD-2024]